MPTLRVAGLLLGIAALPVISLARVAGNAAWSDRLPISTAAVMLVLLATPMIIAGVVITRLPSRHVRRGIAAFGWAAVAFLHVGLIRGGAHAMGWAAPWQWALLGLAVLGIGVWIGARFDPQAKFLTTFVPVLVLTQLFLLGLDARNWDEPTPATPAAREATLGSPPSIWFIVLDSHASPAVLRDLHDVDLTESFDRLAASGFVVWDDARSSYTHTLLSIPSLLSGEVWETARIDEMQAELAAGVQGDTWLVASLKEMGQTVRMIPTNWSRSACGQLVDQCVSIDGYDEHWFFLLLSTPLPDVFPQRLPHPWPVGGLRTLEAVTTMGHDDRHITFVHSLASHPPANVIGSDCMPAPVAEASLETQLLCTHEALWEALASIDLSQDIVVVTSDHGYDLGDTSAPLASWTDSVARGRFSAFTAISTPDACDESLPEQLSGPQILPLVLNCYGAELPVPPHRFFKVDQHAGGKVAATELDWDGWSIYES